MRLIPCLICDNESEVINPKAIARICNKSDGEESGTFVKLLNYKKLMKILDNKQLKLTKDGELI